MTARSDSPAVSQVRNDGHDPLAWCWAVVLAFLALALNRLTIPSKPFFDEVHYLPAARAILALSQPLNTEHPLLGKELIALGIALLGDGPLGWRLPATLATTAGLFAMMRAVWWTTRSAAATLLTGAFLATDFTLLVTARIAMLDAFMLGFAAIALWLCARAVARPAPNSTASARRDLALAGIALGASLASKWSGVTLLMLPGLAFAVARFVALEGRRSSWLITREAAPIPGISLLEAALWLGLLPLAVYFATFAPALMYDIGPIPLSDLPALQMRMASLQSSVVQGHPYQSQWWQWVSNLRPIWYLYEQADGAQRGVLLLGNPLTMLAGLPALALCAVWGAPGRLGAEVAPRLRTGMLACAIGYAASLGLWLFADKPIQFYYHYLLPSLFLCAALSMVLAHYWENGRRWPALATLGGALALFGWFYPILTAGALAGEQSFLDYAWLGSWR